ncbi:MAG TPA: NIPSNAP family protein [Streptosporangiaceae bacterium]|nr:NIPSNAP family protein [Streptosporangiaceae bacterium]
MKSVSYPVVELRQYTLRPGQRDVLIDLFDRELVESQEAAGMAIVGQFRDLDDPDRFVWIRGFPSMPSRARALAGFYAGPVWKAHSAQANATMIDSDNVLLLRPMTARSGFPAPAAARLPAGAAPAGAPPAAPSRILVTLYYRDRPFDQAFADFFDRQARPALIEAGAVPLACLQTEHAENTFPALPVRTGENAFVWLARFATAADLSGHLHQIERSGHWRDRVLPALSAMITGTPQRLRLAPTARSLLR